MKLITWNIQWCRGCDGTVDPARIVRTCRDMADFDVLCFQEVASNFPDLPGSRGEDQFELLARRAPGFTAVPGIAIDTLAPDGTRRRFGNLVLTRLPVLASFVHLLPWPSDPKVPSMQRAAVEVVLGTARGPLRVTTTHLEYYSPAQRTAQIGRLRGLQAEAAGHAVDRGNARDKGGPFARMPRPRSGILTADFNFRVDGPEYATLQAPIAEGIPAYRDAWTIAHAGRSHDPTLALYDKAQWPEDPFACDFIFVTEDLAPRVEDVVVNLETQASDHQPVLLSLSD